MRVAGSDVQHWLPNGLQSCATTSWRRPNWRGKNVTLRHPRNWLMAVSVGHHIMSCRWSPFQLLKVNCEDSWRRRIGEVVSTIMCTLRDKHGKVLTRCATLWHICMWYWDTPHQNVISGCSKLVVEVAKGLQCQICQAVRPPGAEPKVSSCRPTRFGERVLSDSFYVWDIRGKRFNVTHLLDGLTE